MAEQFLYSIITGVKINNKYKISKNKWNKNYKHSTYKITCLNDFITLINIIHKEKQNNYFYTDAMICYRGMENSDWLLRPSISVNNLFDYETNMIEDFEILRPNEFNDCKNVFSKLAKMQHYGLPTRLLDFSFNPLVALYFACNNSQYENKDKDGRIIMHIKEVNYNSSFINMICDMSYRTAYSYEHSKEFVEKHGFDYDNYINRYYISYNDFPLAVPPYLTAREINQQAVFLVFPNDIVHKDKFNSFKYKDEYKIDSKLYTFGNNLRKIDGKYMEYEFSSIIVDKNYKKNILFELNNMGINKSFLFPELEYVAQNVKNKYINIFNSYKQEYEKRINKSQNDDEIQEAKELLKYLLRG